MKVIRQNDRRQDMPISQLRSGELECPKYLWICKHSFPIGHTNRDQINHRLLPSQPDWNAERVSHQILIMAGEAPALQRRSHLAKQMSAAKREMLQNAQPKITRTARLCRGPSRNRASVNLPCSA